MFSWLVISGIVLSYLVLLPLSIKWELAKRITIPSIGFIGFTSGIIIFFVQSAIHTSTLIVTMLLSGIIGLLSISLLLWRFYRDPDRDIDVNPQNILSPADGKVIYIKNFSEGKIPYSEKNGEKYALSDYIHSDFADKGGILIGIAMTFLDVHVNRAPVRGKVSLLKKIPGLFLSLKKKNTLIKNERAFILIENENIQLGIIQIASRLVRNIVPYIKEGQLIKCGERIGMIRFGSQVDLLIPYQYNVNLHIHVGDNVKAGKSIISSLP